MAHLEGNRSRSAAKPEPTFLTGRLRLPRLNWERGRPVLLLLFLLLAWEVSVWAGLLNRLFYPAPSFIGRTAVELVQEGTLVGGTLATLVRLGLGLLLGGVPGVVLGMAMGWLRPVRSLAEPFVAALYPIPKIAILPLLMVVFGIGETPKVIVAALGAFFPLLINTMAGVQQIHPIHFEVAQNYKASAGKIFFRVILPGSLPFMLTGLLLALNVTLLLTVAVEMVSANEGLGALIWKSWQTMRTEQLYASLLVIILLGLCFNQLVRFLSRRLVPWQVERKP